MRISGDHSIVHGGSVISAVGHEGSWGSIQLLEQRLDLGGVINVFGGQIGRDDFTAISVDANMQFAPRATFRCSMFLKQPFARTAQFQSRAIDNQVKRARRSRSLRLVDLQPTSPTAERRMIWNRQVDVQHSHNRTDQPLTLAQSQPENGTQGQSCLDREVGIVTLAAGRCSGLCLPTGDRLVREPDRQASAIAKRCLILPPIRHPIFLTVNVMTAFGMELKRHNRPPR